MQNKSSTVKIGEQNNQEKRGEVLVNSKGERDDTGDERGENHQCSEVHGMAPYGFHEKDEPKQDENKSASNHTRDQEWYKFLETKEIKEQQKRKGKKKVYLLDTLHQEEYR